MTNCAHMSLSEALALPRTGLTAFIGGGGKTALISALGLELSAGRRVIITTTTHIWPPAGVPLCTGKSEAELTELIRCASPVCVAVPAAEGKLTAPEISMERLCALSDMVLAEADGARGLPLKAHGKNEPAVPACAAYTVCVLGVDGIGRPISEAAHRPELYAAALGTDVSHIVTAQDALSLIPAADVLVINKAEGPERLAIAREISLLYGGRAVITSLKNRKEPVTELWIYSKRSY